MNERGSASIVAITGLAAVLVGVVVVHGWAVAASARAHVSMAADAAALAAAPATFGSIGRAASPHAEAKRFADLNGVELVGCICPTDRSWAARTVEVTVAMDVRFLAGPIRRIQASATAEFRPVILLGAP